ncbi:hypothetical protein AB0N05_37535 [Nocardia sp. NPDC051030]|uniref:hypothetical protein n=1 Tax=Nocardia sp. NPDC051030 TaxID=3155162 RepID=UPI003420E95D
MRYAADKRLALVTTRDLEGLIIFLVTEHGYEVSIDYRRRCARIVVHQIDKRSAATL